MKNKKILYGLLGVGAIAVVLNGFSGAWSGTTFFDRLIGKKNKPLESAIVPKEA